MVVHMIPRRALARNFRIGLGLRAHGLPHIELSLKVFNNGSVHPD